MDWSLLYGGKSCTNVQIKHITRIRLNCYRFTEFNRFPRACFLSSGTLGNWTQKWRSFTFGKWSADVYVPLTFKYLLRSFVFKFYNKSSWLQYKSCCLFTHLVSLFGYINVKMLAQTLLSIDILVCLIWQLLKPWKQCICLLVDWRRQSSKYNIWPYWGSQSGPYGIARLHESAKGISWFYFLIL